MRRTWHHRLVRRMSLARQLLVLQLVVVVVAVAVAGGVAVRAADHRAREQHRDRALSVAETLAASGEVRRALRRDDPSAVLQPLAERVRRTSDLGFVVFMSPDGVRFSHPNPSRIGGRFVGTIAPARAGRPFTEVTTGTLGPSVRAVAPVRDGGRVAGLVAVGVLQEAITHQVRRQLPGLLASIAIAVVAGGVLSLLLARRVRRQTRNLDPQELAALYDHHDAVLHAIREGVVVVGEDDRLRLVNAEARRLLGLGEDAIDRPIAEVVEDPSLLAALRGEHGSGEGLHVRGNRVLVTGRRSAERDGRHLATVTTLRDRTAPGRYQILAAINAVHTSVRDVRDTDWSQVVALYDQLVRLDPSPIIALNRAIAVAELDGPEVALAAVDRFEDELAGYHAFHATRADLLRRLGRSRQSQAAYERAIELAGNTAETAALVRRRDQLR